MEERVSKKQLLSMIQTYVATTIIRSTTVRRQPSGTVDAIRGFLAGIDLGRMPRTGRREFCDWLDEQTHRLQQELPGTGDRPWGIARKAMNLFLRSSFYNHFLCVQFHLDRVAPWLEIPLDSVVARGLRKHAGRGALPPWPGLCRLTPDESRRFQEHAMEYSDELGLPARVFLDNYLWLHGR